MTESAPGALPRFAGVAVRVGALLLAFGAGALLFGGDDAPTGVEQAQSIVYTCSMHPQIRQNEPGDCPICGMDLVPAGSLADGGTADRIELSERARTLARLRTEVVSRQADATAEVRLLGKVEPSETTRRNVTTWIGGRIDRLHVNTTGERVRRGQVIATLYSPEVYGAHQDLITARQQVTRLADSPPSARQAAESALGAARERLRLLGVPDGELVRMEEASTPVRAVPIRSAFAGTVIERVATEGAYVQTGAPLYRVADLTRLWVQLDAYESDLQQLAVGQPVTLEVEALPGQTFEGRVAFVDPTVDPRLRTARVRVEVDNPDGSLRPGMFAEAVVAATPPSGVEAPLVVPDTAPLFTGKRSVVYVEVERDGRVGYEPRNVRLGPRLGEVYPVVSGLSEGERVVTRGAFALDADLQIQGGASMMSAPDDTQPAAVQPVSLGADERAMLAPVVSNYLELQRSLAEDDHAAAVKAAGAVGEVAGSIALKGAAREPWAAVQTELTGHATHVAASSDLEGARAGFESLSAAVQQLLQRFGNPLDTDLNVAFCPMAMGSEGATWVQQGETIDNAYFGASMRKCGEIQDRVAPGTHLAPAAEHAH